MDTIQSAIMTSSLINLPHGEEEPGQQPPPHCLIPHTHTHTHTPGAAVSVISRYFSVSLGDPGKVSSPRTGVTLRTEASIRDCWSGVSTAALEGSSRLVPVTGYRCRPGIRTGGLGLGLYGPAIRARLLISDQP